MFKTVKDNLEYIEYLTYIKEVLDSNNPVHDFNSKYYDIIGMSTNRGWSTCIDLNDKKYGGLHLRDLKNTMKRGCLVAYLIRDDDRNINNPISRIAISTWYSSTLELISDTKCYGTSVNEFKDFVRDWVAKKNLS